MTICSNTRFIKLIFMFSCAVVQLLLYVKKHFEDSTEKFLTMLNTIIRSFISLRELNDFNSVIVGKTIGVHNLSYSLNLCIL